MKHWLLTVALPGILLLGGCSSEPADTFQGYIEGEFVYVASPLAGTLTNLAVSRGAEVEPGQRLFVLEHEAETTAVREAEHRVSQARARLENLKKGRRPSEIASLEAQLERAKANLRLAQKELERRTRLRDADVIAPEELDLARSRRDADQAQVEGLIADLTTAQLGAREDEIKAAEAEVAAATAALARARWGVEQKTQRAPAQARVQDTLYRHGEFVPAGNPVVSLLPPANLKVRFFVPEPQLASIPPGTPVSVSFDGSVAPLRATVNYLSSQAEFTPPVIYSKETRAKLVFMVEAAFAVQEAPKLRPGLPVTVRLNP